MLDWYPPAVVVPPPAGGGMAPPIALSGGMPVGFPRPLPAPLRALRLPRPALCPVAGAGGGGWVIGTNAGMGGADTVPLPPACSASCCCTAWRAICMEAIMVDMLATESLVCCAVALLER